MRDGFRRFASGISRWMGTPVAFFLTILGVLGWLATGPHYRWSDAWQIAGNSVISVATLWITILLLNGQNRTEKALHLKVDELIRVGEARNELMSLETKADDVVAAIEEGLKQVDDEI